MEMGPPNPTQPAPQSLPRSTLLFVSAQAFGAGVCFVLKQPLLLPRVGFWVTERESAVLRSQLGPRG